MVPDNKATTGTGARAPDGRKGESGGEAESDQLAGLSSMATRALLAELTQQYERLAGGAVRFLSLGGVDAAQRVRAGERFDVVVLARDSIDKLVQAGHLLEGSVVDLVRSGVAVAVPAGAPRPDIGSAAALRAAVLAARTIGYSTGPSGVALAKLFDEWGLTETLEGRTVVARPGMPVGELVARAEAALGFQQLSELMTVDGIEVVGGLPPPLEIVTVFSGAVGGLSRRPQQAAALLRYLASPAADEAKRRCGMEPVVQRVEERSA